MTAKVLVVLVIAAIVAQSSMAHLCVFNPLQRAPLYDINTQASNSCKLFNAPCGFNTPGNPVISVKAGEEYTVVFQKNENHWTQQNRGNFSINFASSPTGSFKMLAVVEDTNTPSLTVFTANVTIPMLSSSAAQAVLQFIYDTDGGPPNFYQCADIAIVPAVCGDGIVEQGETCDPGTGNFQAHCCHPNCQSFAPRDICGPSAGPCFTLPRCVSAGGSPTNLVCSTPRQKKAGSRCGTSRNHRCTASGKCK